MPNNWGLYGNTKKSIFRKISEHFEFHVPPLSLSWKFFIHPRQTSKFIAHFEKEPENLQIINPSPVLTVSNSPVYEVVPTKVGPAEIVSKASTSTYTLKTIEMLPVKQEYNLSIPSFKFSRKEFQIPWIPKLEVKRKIWNVPLPKIKWKMPLLKKLALTGVIIVFPLLLFSAGFLIYTIKDMYDNGFVNEVMKYKIDEKIRQSEDPLKAQINELQIRTSDLEAHKQNLYNVQVIKKFRYYDVRGRRAYPSANQKAD